MPDTATSSDLPACPHGGTPVCGECADKALADMKAAADAYPELATTVEIITRPSLGRSGAVFPGSPSPNCDEADAILHVLRDAEDWLRIELDQDPAQLPRVHHPDVISAARAYLEHHHDDAMAVSWAPEYCRRIRKAAANAAAKLPAKRDQTVHLELDGICPACEARCLARISTTDRVVCRACGDSMSWDDYQGHFEHLRRLAAATRGRRRLAVSDHAA